MEISAIYPQIRLLYGIKSKAAISLSFNLHCKVIAALLALVPYSPYHCHIEGLWQHIHVLGIARLCSYLCKFFFLQIRLLYGIKSKAAISLPFHLHCKAIAALFCISYCRPI